MEDDEERTNALRLASVPASRLVGARRGVIEVRRARGTLAGEWNFPAVSRTSQVSGRELRRTGCAKRTCRPAAREGSRRCIAMQHDLRPSQTCACNINDSLPRIRQSVTSSMHGRSRLTFRINLWRKPATCASRVFQAAWRCNC